MRGIAKCLRPMRGIVKCLLPMRGIAKDVLGIFSAIIMRKTVKASKTEIPSEIFSPASGGRKKLTMISTESIRHGRTMFIR